jgi:hypothetical protein
LALEVARITQSEMSYRSISCRVHSAERRYQREAADKTEQLVMRTETAAMLFCAAIDKGAAFRTVEHRFRKLGSLPCSYLPSLVWRYAEFGDYCRRQGKRSRGIQLLETLQARMNCPKGKVPKGVLSYCRRQVAQALQELRKG